MEICFKNFEACSFFPVDEKPYTAFVLMPFTPQFDRIYQEGIKNSLQTGWICNRSDERWDIPEAVCKICKSIQEATLIIADVTGRNPNVFLELGLSFGLEKKFIILTQNINDLPFDLRTFIAIEYNPKNLDDLHKKLREAIDQLKPTPRLSKEAPVFEINLEEVEEVLTYHAPQAENHGPAMAILIGSKNIERDWLPPTPENISLLQCAPSFLFKEIRGRHEYYDFQPRYENHFLRILRNGFIISKFPSAKWDDKKETLYIHEMVKYIAQLFLFACRIMKKKGVTDSQRIRIQLLRVKDRPIRFDLDQRLSFWEDRDFDQPFIDVEEDFNPDDDWKSLLDVLVRIYRVICEHAGIIDLTDDIIKANLRKILGWIEGLRTNYSSSGVKALDLNDIFQNI